jgi:tetratricopeptide (TPR) repeat protein
VDTHKLLTEFANLLNSRTVGGNSSTVESFLSLLEPETAEVVRRSAIPHESNPRLLQILVPGFDSEKARKLCEQIASYSFVIPNGDGGFSFHDQTRQELFDWWLTRADATQFTRLSMALVAQFSGELAMRTESDGEVYETLLRKRMYHLVGADQAQGFKEFERLLSRARYQRRFSECATLIKLLRDYDAVLSDGNKAWLTYHEGKLAGDRNQGETAGRLFQEVLGMAEASALTKAAALMRLGNLKHRASSMEEAKCIYGRSLELAESHEEARCIVPRIKHDLGVVYRDTRDCGCAQTLFEDGLALAKAQSDPHMEATILNSLGRLHTDSRRFDEAIKTFTDALRILETIGDRFEIGTICSNLANAHMERGNYNKSYELYERSLKLSLECGNSLGQAEALNNLARVLRAQRKLDEAVTMLGDAVALFLSKGDRFRAGVALQNQARCYKSLRQVDQAEKSFLQAEELFCLASAVMKRAEVRSEIRTLRKTEKMPLLVWLCAALVVLLMALIVIGLMVT